MISWSTFTFLKPTGVGLLLPDVMPDDYFLGVAGTDDVAADGFVRTLFDGTLIQDPCRTTGPLPALTWTSEHAFEGMIDETSVVIDGAPVDLYALTFSGTFSDDYSAVEDLTFSVTVDTRPLGPLVGAGPGDPEAVCELIASFGVDCEECPAGASSETCLGLTAAGGRLELMAHSVQSISEDDVVADPICDPEHGVGGFVCASAGMLLITWPTLFLAGLVTRRRHD